MRKVEIAIFDRFLLERLRLNGEPIQFKKVDKRKYLATIETEEDHLDLSMLQFHPYLVENWWIKEMILYVVGIFGIFNPHDAKSDTVFNYQSKIHLEKDVTELTIRRSFKEKAIEVTGAECEDIANERTQQPLIAKRRKTLKWSKVGVVFGVLLIALLIVLIIALV